MKLSAAYARFYKSFNFDQARKLRAGVERQPWEEFRGIFYPYVTVHFDAKITTVVGANESGKSQLLDAIKKAITGLGIERRDLCRFSPYFTVADGQSCWPHVGVGWDEVTKEEAANLSTLFEDGPKAFDRFLMFREQPDTVTVWLPVEGQPWHKIELGASEVGAFVELLPQPFEIKADVALPNSVPFAYLANGSQTPIAEMSRARSRAFFESVPMLRSYLGGSAQNTQNNSQNIFNLLGPLLAPIEENEDVKLKASLALARSFLLELASVDQISLEELAGALDSSQDGYAGALLKSVNVQLERQLNLRRYWVQDRDFSLRVSIRDRELVFIISDRTGTEYTFAERSSGLRYFLSYLIQSQIHRPTKSRETILLMDEPDTFLSAEAQQDLMRVFRDLASPPKGGDGIQVIYVTHSPFLLDKNHSERIRVLEKGLTNDGTRVVPSVSRNHYEPLRSAFGAFVGETAFVGAVNLLVEGASDQILLAGGAAKIRQLSPGVEDDTLDLNRLVIVPCGSAGEVPYTVFRVRGQGADKPPVVVLLDADEAGRTAAKEMRTDARLKKLISSDLILDLKAIGADLESWPAGDPLEIEDLIPLPLAYAAVGQVFAEVTKFREGQAPEISLAAIEEARGQKACLMDALDDLARAAGGRVDKIAFAKAVVAVCLRDHEGPLAEAVAAYLDRLRIVFRSVNRAKRLAEKATGVQRLSLLVGQQAKLFAMDNPAVATREQARIALDDIEQQLDDSVEGDAIRNAVLILRRDFGLADDPSASVPNYTGFLEGLQGLKLALRVQEPATQRSEPKTAVRTNPLSTSPDVADATVAFAPASEPASESIPR